MSISGIDLLDVMYRNFLLIHEPISCITIWCKDNKLIIYLHKITHEELGSIEGQKL